MNILIIEAYSDANIGSAALVENSVNLLRKIFPAAKLNVLAQSSHAVEKFSGVPTFPELFSFPFRQARVKQVLWLFKNASWMLSCSLAVLSRKICLLIPESLYTFDRRKRVALKLIKEADIVVSVGAERINDNFYKAIFFSLYVLWIIQAYGKFLVLFPQTIGPFHFKVTRFLAARVLKDCQVVYLRDEKSARIVKEMGVKGPLVVNTADVAIMQSALSADQAKVLLHDVGVTIGDGPLIGISAMKWTYVKVKGSSRYNEYKEAIAKVADKLIKEKDARILFLATNLPVHGCREDDLGAAKEIAQLIKCNNRVYVLSKLYTPAQMKGIMGLLDMCIVTRMHACIFSTGIFTPTLSINYQFKLHEYMKLMGLGDYTIDIDQVNYDRLKRLADFAWDNRDAIRKILRGKIVYWKTNIDKELSRLSDYYKLHQRSLYH